MPTRSKRATKPDPTPAAATITRIRPPRARRPGTHRSWARVRDTAVVQLSDCTSYLIASDLRVAAGLHEGDRADRAALADLQRQSEGLLAQRRGLALLARAAHSRRLLARKLRQSGFGAAAVARALARLQELGYLDDAGFARLWVRGRLERGSDGRAKVLAGLLVRGIERAEAQAALEAEYPPEREAQICHHLALRLHARVTAGAGAEARIGRQLAQRGFPGGQIVRALQGAAASDDGTADGGAANDGDPGYGAADDGTADIGAAGHVDAGDGDAY